MKIEIRAKSIKEAELLLDTSADIIAVGDENCIRKVPTYNEIEELAIEAEKHNKKIRVVYPKIPNSYYNDICEHFANVSQLDIEITLNDYGMIYEAGKHKLKNGFTVGRNLAFTIISSPWYELLVEQETKEMKMALAASNMESEYKLKYIKKMGGNAIEIESLPEMWQQTEVIRKYGFSVYAHRDYCLVAFSRCCPILKMNQGKSCEHCNEVYIAEVSKKFVSIPVQDKNVSYAESTHFVEDEEVNKLCPKLYYLGNGLYRKNSIKNMDKRIVSRVIFVQCFYNERSEIENEIKQI